MFCVYIFKTYFCCIPCAQLANIFGMFSLWYLLFHSWQLFWELAPWLLFVIVSILYSCPLLSTFPFVL
jgi:hypothetical protein